MTEGVFLVTMLALVSGVLLLGVVMGPIGRALGRRVEGRGLAEADLIALRDEVQAGTAEVADLRREVAELQERVDFAERLLSVQADHAGLPSGRVRGEN